MKKRRLQIKIFLFSALVVILGVLLALYIAFCGDGSYNEVKIETPTESTTETTTAEPPTEPSTNAEESPSDPLPEENSTDSESSSTEAPVIWDSYDPVAELAGEKWALTLINKTYPLDKKYSPTLSPVVEGSSVTADSRVSEAYQLMYADALAAGYVLTPYSAYCSYQGQQTIYNNKIQSFVFQGMTEDEAKANAEKRIEPAGCSENGAGLSVDIISASAGFASTDEYKWLTQNAFKYGFILRYPDDKTDVTGMIYQPWHWRYVGIDAATEMKNNNQCLEEYLGVVTNE